MRTRFPLVVVAAVALAAACGGGSGTSSPTTATPPASTPATTTVAATTTTVAGTTTTDVNSVVSVREKATAALLTAADLGAGFTDGKYTPSDPKTPTPCGSPSVDLTVPPAVKVGAVVGKPSTQQALEEEIAVYSGTDEADQAFQTGSAGLACPSGTATFEDGSTTPLAISAGTDVTAQVGGDVATAWQVVSSDLQGVVIAVKLEGAIVAFQFQAPASASAADLQPDPIAVAKAGITKIITS
jgi:hypothetical protein